MWKEVHRIFGSGAHSDHRFILTVMSENEPASRSCDQNDRSALIMSSAQQKLRDEHVQWVAWLQPNMVSKNYAHDQIFCS